MSNTKTNENTTSRILITLFIIGASIAGVIIWQALVSYQVINGSKFFDFGTAEAYGTFGDFIGGTLNPIFAFLTFLGILYTIYMQSRELTYTREELRLSREEMARSASAFETQNFDNTFFNLMKMLSDAVTSAIDPARVSTQNGFSAIFSNLKHLDVKWHFEIAEDKSLRNRKELHQLFLEKYSINQNSEDKYRQFEAAKIYEILRSETDKIDHYFRVFYNIVRLIDERKNQQPEFNARKYISLLQANISEAELGLVYANCLTRNGEDLKRLVEKYSLLENMSSNMLIRSGIATQFVRSAYGNNQSVLKIYDGVIAEDKQEQVLYMEDRLVK